MRIRLTFAFVWLFITASAYAIAGGSAFPLTNTRYGAVPATTPRLVSNGTDLYLFWIHDGSLLATLIDGTTRAGNVVLENDGDTLADDFDVAWDGETFLLSVRKNGWTSVRRLDRDAHLLPVDFFNERVRVNDIVTLPGTQTRLAAGDPMTMLVFRDISTGVLSTRTIWSHGSGVSTTSNTAVQAFAVSSASNGFMILSASDSGISVTMFGKGGERIGQRELVVGSDLRYRDVALVRHGDALFATWLEWGGGGTSALLDANGNPGPLRRFGENTSPANFGASAIWSGDDYVLAYHGHDATLHVVHFNEAGEQTFAETRQSNRSEGTTSIAMHEGRTFLAWNPRPESVVETLPLATSQPRSATSGAIPQRLLATAFSAIGTLAIWEEIAGESTETRAGVRTYSGHWTESLIHVAKSDNALPATATASSDGTGFVVALTRAHETLLTRLDHQGTANPLVTTVPFDVTGMAWSGTRYALIGEHEGSIVAARFQPDGTLAPWVLIAPVEPNVTLRDPRIASDGEDFFAVWFGRGVVGAHLGADLSRIDDEDVLIMLTDQLPDVTWDGEHYIIAAGEVAGALVATIGEANDVTVRDFSFTAHRDAQITSRFGGGSAVVWWDTDDDLSHTRTPLYPHHRVVLLNGDGTTAQVFFDDDPSLTRLAPLPQGRVAYITSRHERGAPFHGSLRVSMTAIDATIKTTPSLLHEPLVTARVVNGRAFVSWAPTPFWFESPTGFRVEMRVGNGAWTEIEQWFDGDVRSALFDVPNGTSFRVRAFTLWGAGFPSNATAPVDPRTSKRRATH